MPYLFLKVKHSLISLLWALCQISDRNNFSHFTDTYIFLYKFIQNNSSVAAQNLCSFLCCHLQLFVVYAAILLLYWSVILKSEKAKHIYESDKLSAGGIWHYNLSGIVVRWETMQLKLVKQIPKKWNNSTPYRVE